MRKAATYTLSALGLYAMVASCSGSLNASKSALHGLSGDWQVEHVTDRDVIRRARIAGGELAVDSVCAPDAVRATVDRRGRVSARIDSPCEADTLLAFMGESPALVRIDARTLELRHRRERVRLRKA